MGEPPYSRARASGRRWRSALCAALAPVLSLIAPSSPAQARPVELELVLAVDVSQSVSRQEFALQIAGYARAFRNRQVVGAIRAAGDHGIAVALVQWANPAQRSVAIGWTHVWDAESAARLAQRIALARRAYFRGGTAISSAIAFCLPLFEANGFEGGRKIIDLSGDGTENRGPEPGSVRDLAVALGVTINGLAIVNDKADLERYFESQVIGGSDAFVVTALDYRDFARAIVTKLVREISRQPVALAPARRRMAAWRSPERER